ncbi:hypothetical protein P175DRAFT_0516787 [Aspergillus ochraceoroseus IBT 24754]|uniref:Uncharacterized protein n=2 Tax=Aspergillus ochraceoroseus TaxID=138278 RepID=A0A2T5LY77_9EURO|nr:uncharacterized protein P175DRAFT_0516787 [Aspergillus ochraceoroseus IBT 24754]KKK19870.1 hypothetical protein AOCH_000566 [Aspergillus ochraceoroseus]PTU21235.1 hypothetical protein P175DRAFT_0516787 [Aspergillus ochraceoroseus IBT 24754]
MLTEWTFIPEQDGGTTRNIACWKVSNQSEEYCIDISWPLTWSTLDHAVTANVIYLVDGNALFLTATETLRRRQSFRPKEPATIVVGIGYPLTDSVFSSRRSRDLTPPCTHYTPPDGPDGQPRPEPYGGADQFLTFITDVVRPFIESRLFPHASFVRRALFGHSYGGLFVLHTLFTRPASFDVYLAASPSIWWNNRFILSEASKFCTDASMVPPLFLRLSLGSREQFPVRQKGESMEGFQRRVAAATRRRMTENCSELASQLTQSNRLHAVEQREYLHEDHGSVIAPALSGGIFYFLDIGGEFNR